MFKLAKSVTQKMPQQLAKNVDSGKLGSAQRAPALGQQRNFQSLYSPTVYDEDKVKIAGHIQYEFNNNDVKNFKRVNGYDIPARAFGLSAKKSQSAEEKDAAAKTHSPRHFKNENGEEFSITSSLQVANDRAEIPMLNASLFRVANSKEEVSAVEVNGFKYFKIEHPDLTDDQLKKLGDYWKKVIKDPGYYEVSGSGVASGNDAINNCVGEHNKVARMLVLTTEKIHARADPQTAALAVNRGYN